MLSDVRCRTAKGESKPYKLTDERGLYLYVTPTSFKSWRMKYRIGGKEKRLVFGAYPGMSLVQARARRDAARALLQDGIDPDVDKKQRAAERHTKALNTFEVVARRWHGEQLKGWSPRYATQVLARFESDAFPALGALAITDVTAPLVLEVLRRVEARGAIEGAHRLRQHMSDIFVTAMAGGIATTDPAGGVRKALGKVRHSRRPAMLDVRGARSVIAAIDSADAYSSTRLASRLLALTAARPGVVRLASPSEFEDLDGAHPIWRVPAAKMKLTAAQKSDVTLEFIVPLSRQAVEVVKAGLELTGDGPVLFPSVSRRRLPMSDATMSKLYRDSGFTDRHVPHGWRATFSTVMNGLAAVESRLGDREVIDLMLAHLAPGVEPIYNRYAYMPRRREIAQEWADLLMAGAIPVAELLERGKSARNLRRRRERGRVIDA